ncbi:MAG: cupredoxin domain-containing protein [Acidimicrobiia bacterium]
MRFRLAIAIVISTAVAVSGCSSQGSEPVTELDISMFNNYFEPAETQLSSGVSITVEVTNGEAVGTQFSIHDLAIVSGVYETEAEYKEAIEADPSVLLASTDRLGPGDSTQVVVNFPSPGMYQLVCTIPGHVDVDNMTGVINVEN